MFTGITIKFGRFKCFKFIFNQNCRGKLERWTELNYFFLQIMSI